MTETHFVIYRIGVIIRADQDDRYGMNAYVMIEIQ